MPAKSRAQRIVMAIAEHDPDKLYARNKGAASMSHEQLHDFASTPEKGLSMHKKVYGGLKGKKKVLKGAHKWISDHQIRLR